MAAKQMGVTTGGRVYRYIGTTAEMADLDSAAKQTVAAGEPFGPGSKYWDTTLKKGFVWDGATWQSLV